jgi:hypothetical protein
VPLAKQSVTKFLNVDLDIRSQVGLDEFLESLASSIISLHRANEDAFLALNEHYPTLEETIMGWLKLIDSLPIRMKEIWNQFEFRGLNIGIQAGSEPYASSFAISPNLVSLIADQRLELVFPVYAPDGSRRAACRAPHHGGANPLIVRRARLGYMSLRGALATTQSILSSRWNGLLHGACHLCATAVALVGVALRADPLARNEVFAWFTSPPSARGRADIQLCARIRKMEPFLRGRWPTRRLSQSR